MKQKNKITNEHDRHTSAQMSAPTEQKHIPPGGTKPAATQSRPRPAHSKVIRLAKSKSSKQRCRGRIPEAAHSRGPP